MFTSLISFCGLQTEHADLSQRTGNSKAERYLGLLQLSKLYVNGGRNRQNYRNWGIENMLSIHRVQNVHKLQKKQTTACLQAFMTTEVNTTMSG
jgi:hypothetical protein